MSLVIEKRGYRVQTEILLKWVTDNSRTEPIFTQESYDVMKRVCV